MKFLAALFFVFLVCACATKPKVDIKTNGEEQVLVEYVDTISHYENVDLPAWFYNNSSCGNYSVCINEYSSDRDMMLKQSLEDASVLIARNIACFVIDKKARTSKTINENTYRDGAKFSVQIADSFAIEKVKNSLNLIAEQKLGGYYLTFYSLNENQHLEDLLPFDMLEKLPEAEIEKTENSVYVYVACEARSLKLAFENAIKLARKKMAKHLETSVVYSKEYRENSVEKNRLTKENSTFKLASAIESTKYIKENRIIQINIQKSKKRYKVLLKMGTKI